MSIEESHSPDVLVLGMPSSGKTVFLSVLGRNFTLVADDSDARPLGFRMRAIGRSTLETVSRNYAKLLGGEWPESTVAGSITPLTWDVFTGARKVFTLSSMDVSGESFVKAFGESGREVLRQDAASGLLDDDESATITDAAADLLRKQAASARVICFFVNIAAARRGLLRGGAGGQRDFDAIRNYEEGIANICSLLDEVPALRQKALVVLTQAHRHQDEIEKAGGPAAYLGRIAPSLRQSVAEFSIPVIAVSAINERDSGLDFDDEDEDENTVPETIESDGLFGFLLIVAGMIPDAPLATVADCYIHYLTDKSRCLQLSCRTILERKPLVEAYANSGYVFAKSCLGYLDDPANVNSFTGADLPRSAIELYRRCTMSDKDVVAASSAWKRRLAIDRAWDSVFRRIVLEEAKAAADETGSVAHDAPTARGIVETVQAELAESEENLGNLTFAALYGFEREELDPVRDAADEDEWVMKCLDGYRRRIVSDLNDYMQLFVNTRQRLSELDPERDGDFNSQMDLVLDGIARCRRMSETFKTEWGVGSGSLEQLDSLDRELTPLEDAVESVQRRHSRFLDAMETARQKKIAADAKARQIAYEKAIAEERRRRRNRWLMLLVLNLAALAGLAVVAVKFRNGFINYNKEWMEKARKAYKAGDYDGALKSVAALRSYPWLLISREKFVPDGFVERVKADKAEKIRRDKEEKALKEKKEADISKARRDCCEARKRAELAGAKSFVTDMLKAADSQRDNVEKKYKNQMIDAQSYIRQLEALKITYDEVSANATDMAEKLKKAQVNLDKARTAAEQASAGSFATNEIAKAARAYEALDQEKALTFGQCLKRFEEIEEMFKNAKTLAGQEAKAKRVKDEQKRKAIDDAKRKCAAVRKDAVEKWADEFAKDKLDEADKALDKAGKDYSKGSMTCEDYINKINVAKSLYASAAELAHNNAKPRVRLRAMLHGTEKQVAAKITIRGVNDWKCYTKENDWLNVPLKEETLNANLVFVAEYEDAKQDKHKGEVSVNVRKGQQDATILIERLPEDVLYCANCGYSLKYQRNKLFCPRCGKDPTKYKVGSVSGRDPIDSIIRK